MTARSRLLALAVLVLGVAGPLAAPGARAAGAPEVASIDALCASSGDRALRGSPTSFVRIFGRADDGHWQPVSADVLGRIAREPNLYSEVAETWFADGAVAVVAIAARSLEIRVNTSYCYRSEGSLARVIESSSGGAVRDEETRYFDESGNVVSRSSQFYDIFPRPGRTLSPDLRPGTPELYLTVRALPFYAMLPK
ncbi:MAG: hypothetical protein GIW95_06325 [Candidatus Eremiobacteraeota bacterium]|nr:hypothetical protein [Candidatus Eremiobacteraeota bacterium]